MLSSPFMIFILKTLEKNFLQIELRRVGIINRVVKIFEIHIEIFPIGIDTRLIPTDIKVVADRKRRVEFVCAVRLCNVIERFLVHEVCRIELSYRIKLGVAILRCGIFRFQIDMPIYFDCNFARRIEKLRVIKCKA